MDAIQTPRIAGSGAPPRLPVAADARGINVKADSAATANALRDTRPIRMPQKAADPPGRGSLRAQHARSGPDPGDRSSILGGNVHDRSRHRDPASLPGRGSAAKGTM
ncbi:hypothetical protein GCM10010103_48750 [Streptomyces paradoxus]